ncbi:hypothetical protein ACJJID_06150 [Microbulbifer sp. CnH-101-G]|uniref:hypothetical protein n=1 Tax=Microbulbifer sp. CnH-101-G TaxID=3243393 RepID=UPI00403A1CBD
MSKLPLQNIVGSRIESAKFDKPSKSWLIHFANGDSLNIECMWRLIEDGCICSTSDDHDQMFGRDKPFNGEAALNEMAEHEILSAQCNDLVGDISIKLGEYFVLEVVAISAGYESWQYKQKGGNSFVAVSVQVHSY